MRCLNDSEIQAAADNEAADAILQHVRTCRRCSERVRDRETIMAGIRQAIQTPLSMPDALSRRIGQALADGSSQGATRLRDSAPTGRTSRRAFWSAVAVAAATLVVIFLIIPMMKGPTTVSAAEILAASANRLAQPDTQGVEFLEYELTLDGAPRGMMPDHANGTYRVKQIIDHAKAGHYR